MGVFWDRIVKFVQSSLRSAERQGAQAPLAIAAGAPARYSPNASLEAIGMQNETLREQMEEVEYGFGRLEEVRRLFHALLAPMSELLADFESTRTRLHETRLKLGLIEDAHESLNARHSAALEERDQVAEARNALLRENRELGQRLQRVEAALSEAQLELRERGAANEKLQRLLEVETRRSGVQADEIRRLKDELSSKDQALANLELAFKAANDQGAVLSQENAALRDSSQSLASDLEAARRRVAENESRLVDCEAEIDQGKHRIAALEQALSEEQSAHANLRAKHLESVERSRSETTSLTNTVHAVRGRVDLTNRLLVQTRGQLREKIEELRAAERRLLESGIQVDALEKSARAHKDDLAAANERIAGTERMRGALIDQVNALNETVRAKEAALQSATRTIEQLTVRLEEATSGRQRVKEELERRTAALQDEIAHVRAERQLADGALEASRAERQQARRAAPTPVPTPVPTNGEARREAETAPALAEPVEPAEALQTNVAKLPRTASA